MSTPQAGAPAQHLPSVGYYFDPDGFNFENSNGQLALRWTDENGQPRQLLYDSNGMRWDGNSVEGQSDIMRDYLQLMQSMEPNWPPVMYQEVAGGILQLEYGVATVLYATALGTFDGQAAHTQGGDEDTDGGEAFIGLGSAQMISLQDNTIENSTAPQAVQVVEDGQIQTLVASGPAAMGAAIHGPQIPRGRDPIVFVPLQASAGGSLPHSLPPPKCDITVPQATNGMSGRIGWLGGCIKGLQTNTFELRFPAPDSSLVTTSTELCAFPN